MGASTPTQGTPASTTAPAFTVIWEADPREATGKLLRIPGEPTFAECQHDIEPAAITVIKRGPNKGLYTLCVKGCGGLGKIIGDFQVVA